MEDINKKRRKKYGFDTKHKIIKLTDKGYSYLEIARKKNIPLSCISKWEADRQNIENPLFKSSFRRNYLVVEKSLLLQNTNHIYVNI